MTAVTDRIKADVESNDIVLFMKGTPAMPQCGFSATVIHILDHVGVKYKAVNVLADPEIRQRHQGILELADDPPALREGRIRRRLRHHQGNVRERRTAPVP